MSKWVVLDIEGTLSATDQVLVVLYDYARPRLGPWIEQHGDDPVVADAVRQIKELAGHDDVVKALHDWMDADQKVTPLKTLQGLIWQQGYAQGDLVAEFFPDVVPAIRKWHGDGVKLAIFSSGSVAGQIAFFQHTTDGDLTPLLEHHFDTVNAGPKREAASYHKIAETLQSDDITFYSDVPAELHAALEAGWKTVGVARAGEPYGNADFTPHPTVWGAVVTAELARECVRFAQMGWMRGTSGNLSVVLQRDPLRLAVTVSGVDKGEITAEDSVVIDENGDAVDSTKVPSAEAALHARIARVAGAGAVVHVHALAIVVAAEHWPGGVVLKDLEMLKGFGRYDHEEVVIPVVRNSQDMLELGDAFEKGFDPKVPALLVARHGVYVWGDDLVQARHRLECLEWLLRFKVETRDIFTGRQS